MHTRVKPLVIGSDEAFPVYSQDPVTDVQPSIGSGRSVRDQRADVDPGGIQRSVLHTQGSEVFMIHISITKISTN